MKVRPVVQKFALDMERHLRAHHDLREGWQGETLLYLHSRAADSLAEVRLAIRTGYKPKTIIAEAVDTALWCMMLADNAKTRRE